MNIQVMSDLHLECASFVLPVSSADVIVLAGDIGVSTQGIQWAKDMFDVPVIYVAGNHEYWDPSQSMLEHKSQMQALAFDSHVHFLDNDVLIIDAVRFVGTTLWTDLTRAPSALYSDMDRIIVDDEVSRDVGGLLHFTTDYAQKLFDLNVAWLKSELGKPFKGKTVVVTHHAPSRRSEHAQYAGNVWNPCFMSNLEELMGDDVDLWLHGHTHNNFDYTVNGTRVVCNPRGYPYPEPLMAWENPFFNPAKMVEIE